jgi:hypothetical protein
MTDLVKASRLLGLATALAVLLPAMLIAGTAPGWAQEEGEARLGGGSDLPDSTVVRLPQGGGIPPIHYIFADNPQDEPIRVEFRAEAPAGISIDSQWEERTVAANGRVENRFGITASRVIAVGEYRVVVQLVRSDIEPEPGQVTNLPAVQVSFTVSVTGEKAAVVVKAVSGLTGQPVAGTLSLSATLPEGGTLELHRTEGSTLEVEVAPGTYRAAFLLGERTVAFQDFEVAADETVEVVLEVEAVSFVLAAVRPVEEDGRPVVVDLVAGVNNEAETVEGPVSLQAVVLHQGAEIDAVILRELTELSPGITNADATYRPEAGWQPGIYGFRFELVTPTFTLTAPEVPAIEVPLVTPWLDLRALVVLAAAAVLLLMLLWQMLALVARRRRRRHERKTRRRDRQAQARTELDQPDGSGPAQPIAPFTASDVHREPAHASPAASGPPSSHTGPAPTTPAAGDQEPGPPPAHTFPHLGAPSPATPQTSGALPSPMQPARRLPSPLVPPEPPVEDHVRFAEALRTIQQLDDQGRLASEWSIADATFAYWAISSPAIRTALSTVGMHDDEFAAVITRLLRQGLLRPDAATNQPY